MQQNKRGLALRRKLPKGNYGHERRVQIVERSLQKLNGGTLPRRPQQYSGTWPNMYYILFTCNFLLVH